MDQKAESREQSHVHHRIISLNAPITTSAPHQYHWETLSTITGSQVRPMLLDSCCHTHFFNPCQVFGSLLQSSQSKKEHLMFRHGSCTCASFARKWGKRINGPEQFLVGTEARPPCPTSKDQKVGTRDSQQQNIHYKQLENELIILFE